MRNPTHVITARNQYFGEVGHILQGQHNLVKVTFLIHSTRRPVIIRRDALMPLNPCDTTTQEVNIAQIEREAVNDVLLTIANEIQRRSLDFEGFTSEMSLQKVKTHTEVIQLLTSFMR
jgi:hypothetical protein